MLHNTITTMDSADGQRLCWTSLARVRISAFDSLVREASASNEVTLVRRQLASEIDELSRIVVDLTAYHNALLPISHLPPELLLRVFRDIAEEEPPYLRLLPGKPVKGSLGWIRLAHVCRRWREVIMIDRFLWAGIVCTFPTATAEILRRSESAPITIRCNIDDTGNIRDSVILSSLKLALSALSHARKISVAATGDVIQEFASDHLTLPAPLLESFELTLTPRCDRNLKEMFVLPEELFSGHSPLLHHVVLNDCYIPWNSSVFRELKHLEIRLRVFSVPDAFLPSFDQLLDLLGGMPELGTLTLAYCIPLVSFPGDSTLPSDDRIVSLPLLSHLSLSGKAETCNVLMRHISLPVSVNVHLECSSDNGGTEFFSLLTLVTPLARDRPPTKPIVGLSFEYTNIDFIVRFWTPNASLEDEAVYGPFHIGFDRAIDLSFRWPGLRLAGTAHAVAAVCHALHVADVQILAVTLSDSAFTTLDWIDAFAPLRNVQTLFIQGPTVYPFADALTRRIGSQAEQVSQANYGDVFLPKLHTLWLSQTDLRVRLASNQSFCGVCAERLKSRANDGARISYLKLEHCLAELASVHSLGQAVQAVDWDGHGVQEDIVCTTTL